VEWHKHEENHIMWSFTIFILYHILLTIGVLGFDSRQRLGIFLFTIASRTALGSTQPPIQWISGALSLGVNRSGREADFSPPFSTGVKEWVELYLQYASMAWCLVKAQGQLYFLPHIIRRIWWAGHKARTWYMRNGYRICQKPERTSWM
jgi:hypothetical protein